ncbi:MAG: hypothetical protein ABEI75_00275 [Halobaculum sp.]
MRRREFTRGWTERKRVDLGPEPILLTELEPGDRVDIEYESDGDRRHLRGTVTRTCGGSVVVATETTAYRVNCDTLSVLGQRERVGLTETVNRVTDGPPPDE